MAISAGSLRSKDVKRSDQSGKICLEGANRKRQKPTKTIWNRTSICLCSNRRGSPTSETAHTTEVELVRICRAKMSNNSVVEVPSILKAIAHSRAIHCPRARSYRQTLSLSPSSNRESSIRAPRGTSRIQQKSRHRRQSWTSLVSSSRISRKRCRTYTQARVFSRRSTLSSSLSATLAMYNSAQVRSEVLSPKTKLAFMVTQRRTCDHSKRVNPKSECTLIVSTKEGGQSDVTVNKGGRQTLVSNIKFREENSFIQLSSSACMGVLEALALHKACFYYVFLLRSQLH